MANPQGNNQYEKKDANGRSVKWVRSQHEPQEVKKLHEEKKL